MRNTINYVLILIGAVSAFYGKNLETQNNMFLIIGMMLVLIGVYRISKRIPSKNEDNDNSFLQ